jgi:hypothetical protein
MKTLLAPIAFVALLTGLAWGRRAYPARRQRRGVVYPAPKRQLEAAVRAALEAEAERMAAPYRSHVAAQLAALKLPAGEEFGGDFPEVEALLVKAGLCAL